MPKYFPEPSDGTEYHVHLDIFYSDGIWGTNIWSDDNAMSFTNAAEGLIDALRIAMEDLVEELDDYYGKDSE